MLQGGDCAETFAGVTADNVRNKLRVLLQMAVVLTYAASVPVVKVGRIAGQYAKPRSSDLETREGVTLPAYRGDAVNGFDFTAESRVPDPQRLVDVYNSSAATLNLVRAFVTGGYADLRQVHTWNTDFVRESADRPALRAGGRRDRAGADLHAGDRRRPRRVPPGRLPHLPRGAGARLRARDDPHRLAHRARRTTSPAHFVWIGERTRQLDGAHVELLRAHPQPDRRQARPDHHAPTTRSRWPRKLNPDNEPGRLTFITRFGAGKIRDGLPDLVEKVTASGVEVAWVCDPMHGNTFEASSGYKTRRFDDVIEEVQGFFDVHRSLGTWPGRRPRRAHRRRRDRVRRRRRGAGRDRPAAPATSRSATRGSTGCSRWSWPSWSRRCCAPPEPRPEPDRPAAVQQS